MKLFKTQILIIVAILLAVSINSYKVKSRNNVRMNVNNHFTVANATANASAGNSTVLPGKPGSDVVGDKNLKSRIDVNPYTVSTCDQIVEFAGKTIDDMTNYAAQTPRFFTLNMYSIVQFKSKDVNTFERLLNVAALTNVPDIIQGSISCIMFQTYDREIKICMPTLAEANLVLEAYKQFMKCRAGNDLKVKRETPAGKLQNMLNIGCLGLDVSYDKTEMIENPAKAEAALNASINAILKKMVAVKDTFLIDTSVNADKAGTKIEGANKGKA